MAPSPGKSFADPSFLADHAQDLLAFYQARCLDTQIGGYLTYIEDDGTVFDAQTRHLVWQARHLYCFALGARFDLGGGAAEAAQHGVAFLREAHRDRQHGGYFWILDGLRPVDDRKHAYGHSFVLLAAAAALLAGLDARALFDDVDQVLESRFWRPDDGLYVDEINRDWSVVDPARGQNVNMHLVEALLEAFEATGELRFLDRAEAVARRVVVDLAAQSSGLIWEFFQPDWLIDWERNREKPKELFLPYGFHSGHLMEWAKLLLLLEEKRPSAWLLPAAQRLYAAATDRAWDRQYGGFMYTFAPDGTIINDRKYYWVMAEAFAVAAMLYARTGDRSYVEWYNRTWEYIWEHMVDHQCGGWYALLSRDNQRRQPAFARGKIDFYHQLGACVVAARCLSRDPSKR